MRKDDNNAGLTPLVLLVCLTAVMVVCLSLFPSRFAYQAGMKQLKLNNYDKALQYFREARESMPEFMPEFMGPLYIDADLFRINAGQGRTLYHSAIEEWKENGLDIEGYRKFQRGWRYLKSAHEAEPGDYRNAYWLARTEEALERTFPSFFPDRKNPYNAGALYQNALDLRPAGITVRQAFAGYLHYKGHTNRIPGLVEEMMAVYPLSYYAIQKQRYYTEALGPWIEKGLRSAVGQGTLVTSALKALSDFYKKKGDHEEAIQYFLRYMHREPDRNTASTHIRLGRLYLADGQYGKSLDTFAEAVRLSENIESTINTVYTTFRKQEQLEKFLVFAEGLSRKGGKAPGLEIAVAKTWMRLERPELAREALNRVNAESPDARAYYLLAKIAQKEKNWNEMEIAVQKAVSLDRDNPGYYYMLSKALYYQKKYAHAEEIVSKAIQYSKKPNPWYFNFRARMRWRLEKYEAAAGDWKNAFAEKPDRGDFAMQISLALEKQGKFKQSLDYIGKAIAIEPDNERYRKIKNRIETYAR